MSADVNHPRLILPITGTHDLGPLYLLVSFMRTRVPEPPVAIPNFSPVHLSSAEVASRFDHYIEVACAQHQIFCVHGASDQRVLIISQQDLEGWLQTKYLTGMDSNSRALMEAIDELNAK